METKKYHLVHRQGHHEKDISNKKLAPPALRRVVHTADTQRLLMIPDPKKRNVDMASSQMASTTTKKKNATPGRHEKNTKRTNSRPPHAKSRTCCRHTTPTHHTENTIYMGIPSTWMTTMKAKKNATPFTDSGSTKREQKPRTHPPLTPTHVTDNKNGGRTVVANDRHGKKEKKMPPRPPTARPERQPLLNTCFPVRLHTTCKKVGVTMPHRNAAKHEA